MCCQLGSARMGVAFPDDIMRVDVFFFALSCYLIFKWYSNGQCSSTERRNKRLPVWGGGVQGVYEGVAHLPKLLVDINYPTHAVRGSFFFYLLNLTRKKVTNSWLFKYPHNDAPGASADEDIYIRSGNSATINESFCSKMNVSLFQGCHFCIDCTIYLMTTWPLAHTSPTGGTWTTKNNENGQ